MIVDSSAMLAIALGEDGHERYVGAIVDAAKARISAANWFESFMVVEGRGDAVASERLEAFIQHASIEIAPVMPEHAVAARSAWRRFGRGRHKARLNYGDCFAYALSNLTGEPLLFKGDDFTHTDIRPALEA